MSVNSLQLHILNSYLESVAKTNAKKFTPLIKVNFIKDETKILLEKLEAFFKKQKHINIPIFMNAPFKMAKDVKRIPLSFYLTKNAIGLYFVYLSALDVENPDYEDNFELILKGIKFVKDFCIEKNISLLDYLNYTDGVTYSWGVHLLSRDITLYNILAFSHFGINVYMLINKMAVDERELFLNEYSDKLSEFMRKFNNSDKTIKTLIRGYKKIEKLQNTT